MKSISAGIGGFVFGIIVAVVVMGAIAAERYDFVMDGWVRESIHNAGQLRRGESDEVLGRIDAMLQGPGIKESLTVFIRRDEARDKAYLMIDKYRSEYEPLEAADDKAKD